MQGLFLLSGHEADNLGKMELVAGTVGQQELVARPDDAVIQNEFSAGRRARHQSARACGLMAGKVIRAGGGGLDVRHQIIEGCLYLPCIDEIFNDHRAVTLNGPGQVFCRCCCG